MPHIFYQRQRQRDFLENRAANERQADRLALVLAQPCFVIFDSVTGYNHPIAADQIEQWQDQIDKGDARIVYYTFTCSCGMPATETIPVGERQQPACEICASALTVQSIPAAMAMAALGIAA